jgi:5-methylcytosine-specific restriction endonuclease McrA
MSDRTKGTPKNRPSASTRPEVADKIRQWWTPERREAARQRGERFAVDPEWRQRCGSPGEANPMWEDGRTQIPYARGWARKVKQLAWQRANYHCEICGSDKPHDTHHKDFRKDNHSLDNLQVLCRKCHKRLHVEHLRGE